MKTLAAFACIASLASGAAFAQAVDESASRTIEMEFREGGQLIGSPSVTVQLGRTAAVSVAGHYSLRLKLVETEADAYLVRSTLYRPSASDWTPVAAPAVTVAEGESAQLSFAAADGSQLSLALLVR